MKRFLGTIGCLLAASVSIAQSATIKGKVADAQTKEPLTGAIVRIGQTAIRTDDNGRFTANNKSKSQTLTVSFVGYQSQTISTQENDLQIFLQPNPNHLQPLEVTATRASEKAPFAKTNLGEAAIAKQNFGQDLPFLLNQTPSVVANSDAGNGVGYTGIRIRGTDATRINMTINGIPYNDAESQGLFFVNLPDLASSVNSIQVQRGVGTSSNGAGAFGATMNLSTNSYQEQAYGEVNNSYGSFNTWKNTVKAGTGLINGKFTVDARLSSINSDGFIDRANTNMRSFYLSGAYFTKKSSLRFNVISGKEKTYQAWYGIPEAFLRTNRRFNAAGTEKPGNPYENETDNYQQDHYQLFFNHTFNARWSFNTAFFLTRGKGYYEQYKASRSFSSIGLPNPVVGGSVIMRTDLIRQLWLDNYFFGQVFSAQYKHDKHQLTLGGGWNQYDARHYGKIVWAQVGVPKDHRWYYLDAYKKDANLYTKWQYQLGKGLELFTDLQYRRVDYIMNGFRDNPTLFINRQFNFFNPKAGLTYSLPGWQFYASYAKGSKEPNRDDFEAGAVNQPKAEHLHDIEAGVTRRIGAFSWSANFYYMLYRDQLVLTGKVNDVGAYTRVNIPDSYRMGLELQGSGQFSKWLRTTANLTISRNKIKNFTEFIDDYDNGGQITVAHNNTDIAFSPALVGGATISILPNSQSEIAFISKYVGRQYLDNTQNKARSLNPFFVQDIRASYQFNNLLFKEWTIALQVNNLLNRLYEPNGYTFSYFVGGQTIAENYYFPMAGTNFMASLNIRL